MALVFEYEKSLNAGKQPYIAHETNSKLYNYYVDGEQALDKNAFADFGSYGSISFDDESKSLTTQSVDRIGVKNFPGVGGIGFYKGTYAEDAKIVAPIHSEPRKFKAPVLDTVEIVDGQLHVVITPPADIGYTCYRIVVVQGNFAFEYISYKTEHYAVAPDVKGTYTVYCIGYVDEGTSVSEQSNELPLVVTSGSDSYAPVSAYYTKEQIDALLGLT